MTRKEVVAELQQVQSDLIRDIDRLQSLSKAIDVGNSGAKLLVNYVVPHLKYLVQSDQEFSDLLPSLSDVIAGVGR